MVIAYRRLFLFFSIFVLSACAGNMINGGPPASGVETHGKTTAAAADNSASASRQKSRAGPNTYYVSANGSNHFGTGTSANPWKTIGYGIGRLAGGDTLIVKRGTYTGTANFIQGMPAGSPGRYTLIMAEAPMEVRIQSTTSVSSNPLRIAGNYVKVDGFIFDMSNSAEPAHIGVVGGSYNKVTRCIFKRAGSINQWGGLLRLDGDNNLVEDVAGAGACRYCFDQGGPTASTQRNIWRRIVGRFDYSNSALPKATFATYGNNGDDSVRDHLYQNIIAINGQNPGSLGGEEKYGAFYFPKRASFIRIQGSLVIDEGVGHSGIFAREWGTNNSIVHSVAWDLNNSTSWASGMRANSADHITIGGYIPGSDYNLDGVPTNALIQPNLTNLVNNAAGAVVMKRYGVSGTLWGEPGYDQLTNEDLWPWPYEDKIKAVFAEANTPPSGNSPSTNNTKRGFTADGNGLYGGPVSLTSYVWEYLGSPCPAAVCPGP
jgi:hypothetical protein